MTGTNVVGVQFRQAGKIYHFNAKDLLVRVGDKVVVDTDRGPSLAEVSKVLYQPSSGKDLKPVLRVASEKDLQETTRITKDEALTFCGKQAKELGLDMRIIDADIQFGGNKIILYFSAPSRVDFRELVKKLATGLRSRVELKQIGARDETKLAGGVGICGREFCCSSFLREFVPVSIKMAKNQNLALNPNKVSGGCGRLLCCLTYEDETYSFLRKKLPPRGTKVRLPDGSTGDVIRGDILNQIVVVESELGQQVPIPVAEIDIISKRAEPEPPVTDDWAEDIDLDLLMEKPVPNKREASEQAEATSEERSSGEERKKRPRRGRNRRGKKKDDKDS